LIQLQINQLLWSLTSTDYDCKHANRRMEKTIDP
jgi:hypothetical protein